MLVSMVMKKDSMSSNHAKHRDLTPWFMATGIVILLCTTGIVHADVTAVHHANLIKPLEDKNLQMTWNVSVHQDGGKFIVYRGDELGQLTAIGFFDGAKSGSFRYVDKEARPARSLYQLRFKCNDGREIVLATLRVRNPRVDNPSETPSIFSSYSPAVLPTSSDTDDGGGSDMFPVDVVEITGYGIEPPIPPPKIC